jgi:purine-binding chemotaxis protein CheW
VLEERLAALEAELRMLRREVAPRPAAPMVSVRGLVCEVGEAHYAIPVERVREIVRYVRVTPVSDVPDAVAGVIDVRGRVIPVVDARRRFGQSVEFTARRLAIVLADHATGLVGIVVDGVVDVVDIDGAATAAPTGVLARALGVAAVARTGERVLQILDIDAFLSLGDWEAIARAVNTEIAVPAADSEAPNGRA